MSPHRPGSPDCREAFARLSEYLDGELDPAVCAQLDGHLADCPPCEAFLESLRRTVRWTRDLPATELPEDLRRELLRAYRDLREGDRA